MNPRIAQIRTQAETALADFLARAPASAGALAVVRENAAKHFADSGLPHRRVEAWHYTDLRNIMREAYAPAIGSGKTYATNANSIAIVDGVCAGLPGAPVRGLRIRALRDVLAGGDEDFIASAFPGMGADDALVALNAGLAQDGVVIEVAPGARIRTPVEIFYLTEAGEPRGEISRSILLAGAGSSVTIVENHGSAARTQRNSALVCRVGEGARVEHLFMTGATPPEMHVASLHVDVAADASFQSFSFVAAGDMLRRQCFVRQSGEHAKIALRGVSLLKGRQHADTTLVIDHAVPHGESRELFKHIVTGGATAVYQGKVLVRPHAQKTNGVMKSQALLLSDDAAMYNKPELEIYADDVVCGHGATVGDLDADQLFYLMTRGLPKPLAEAMLIEAFALEAIEFVAHEELRQRCEMALRQWLEARST